jgi:hypothetical protein
MWVLIAANVSGLGVVGGFENRPPGTEAQLKI